MKQVLNACLVCWIVSGKNPEVRLEYDDVIRNQIEKGIDEEVRDLADGEVGKKG